MARFWKAFRFGAQASRVCTGVDLGTHEIKVVRMAHNGSRPAVLGWAAVPSPAGAEPDGPNRPETAAALEEALQAAGAVEGADGLVTAIGGGRVITRNILLPAMPERELETAVQWEAERHIPVPLDQLVIRHVNLGEVVTEGTTRLHVLLVGAPRKLVRDYAALFREAGRELSAVDLQCLALWRLFFGFQPEKIGPETVALLDIGANHTELVIVQDGSYCGSRSLPGGAGNLSGALYSLSGTGPAADCEPGENREVRCRAGASWRETGPEYAAGAFGAHLLPNIRRSLEWYQSRNRGRRVERLIVSGGGSRKDGVTGYLAGQLSLPVDTGRAPVSFPGAQEAAFDPKFAVAAGLALWEMVR
jgi:type IV pilus assembly protein PilM